MNVVYIRLVCLYSQSLQDASKKGLRLPESNLII